MAKAATYPQDESLSLTDKLFGTDGSVNKNYTLENLRDFFELQIPRLRVTSVKTSDYTAVAFDFVLVDATSGEKTVDLPLVPETNDLVSVSKRDNSNNVVIDGNGKNINGASTKTITAHYGVVNLRYTGTEWMEV